MYRRLVQWSSSNRLAKDRNGLAGIEFAITAPVVAIFLIGAVDIGMLVYKRTDAASAIQTGAQYYMSGGSDTNAALAAVKRSWTSMPSDTVLASTKVCFCAEFEHSCTQNCPDTSLPVAYHRITATITYDGTLVETKYVISENVRVR
jgi:Flp pilus assembly protein TadG